MITIVITVVIIILRTQIITIITVSVALKMRNVHFYDIWCVRCCPSLRIRLSLIIIQLI